MGTRRPVVLITCGEESGDLHASVLVKELISTEPAPVVIAMGGDRTSKAGAELLFHYKDYAVMGFSGVVRSLPTLMGLEKALKRRLDDGVDLFIPVDYPGLNLRLAQHAKRRGIPVLYYIGPQVWAWGRGRIGKIRRSVDCMAVILPFEKEFYDGVRVEFVGHPFVENGLVPKPLSSRERGGVGLLPGSRPDEVRRILPILLRSAGVISEAVGDEDFAVAMAPSVSRELYEGPVREIFPSASLEEDALALMRKSRVVLVASGTATLQAGLLETPMVIVYRVSSLNYLLASRLVKVANIGLVNIILGEEVCPEFVQRAADPREIARAAIRYLTDEREREMMLSKLSNLREMLSGSGGARRVAEIARGMIFAGQNAGGRS